MSKQRKIVQIAAIPAVGDYHFSILYALSDDGIIFQYDTIYGDDWEALPQLPDKEVDDIELPY